MNINPVDLIDNAYSTSKMEKTMSDTKSFDKVLNEAVSNESVSDNQKAELKKACQEFETYFTQMMFKEMRKTVNSQNSVLPKSHTEEIFQEMIDEEYSKKSSQYGNLGLAQMMYKQMLKNL